MTTPSGPRAPQAHPARHARHALHPAGLALAALSVLLVPALSACSSAPKRPPEVFTNRNAAAGQLDLGNQTVTKGDFASAYSFLDEAWRLAVSTDDPATRVRVLLARGNALFNEGKRDKAEAEWAKALAEAEEAGQTDLASACRIYRARGTLPEGLPADALPPAERAAIAAEAKAIVLREMPNVRGNDLYTAFAWKVIGLSEKELGDAAAAETAIRKAAAIHEGGRYLEDAAYDWYLVASIRSKFADYPGAIAALQTAIGFDRRAENANGLGMDWLAIGTVREKAGMKEEAIAAYGRAAEIFRSAFLTAGANEAEKRRAALSGAASGAAGETGGASGTPKNQ